MENILNIAWLGLVFGMIGTTLGGVFGVFINFKILYKNKITLTFACNA